MDNRIIIEDTTSTFTVEDNGDGTFSIGLIMNQDNNEITIDRDQLSQLIDDLTDMFNGE